MGFLTDPFRLRSARRVYNGSAKTDTDASSYTYNSVPIGDAATDRVVVILTGSKSNTTNRYISRVRIGGIDAQPMFDGEYNGGINTGIWYALVPTGTTAQVIVDYSGTVFGSAIFCYSIYDAWPDPITYERAAFGTGSTTSEDITIEHPAGGIYIAAAHYRTVTSAPAFSPGTLDASELSIGGGDHSLLGASGKGSYDAAKVLTFSHAARTDYKTLQAATWGRAPTREGGTLVGPYRYIKWSVTNSRNDPNSIQVSEFLLAMNGDVVAWPAGTSVTANRTAVSGTEGPDKLIDGLSSTKFCETVNQACDITFDCGSGQSVTFNQYAYTTANDFLRRDPVTWTLQGSNDGSSWTTLDTVTNFPAPPRRFAQSRFIKI